MAPTPENVRRMVGALFAVMSGMQKARKERPDAAALAVLQVIGAVERDEPGRGVRPSEIATVLDVHRSAVTHHVRTLSRAGHIVGATDPGDRRSSLLSLTESGHAEVDRLARHGMARFTSFVADWTDDEVLELATLLEKFLHSADTVNAKEPS